MQPTGREMQGDFFNQMLPTAWTELGPGKSPWDIPAFDESALLASRLRHHQTGGGGGDKPVMLHLSDLHGLAGVGGGEDGANAGFLPLPLFTDRTREDMDAAAFMSPNADVRVFGRSAACLLQSFRFSPCLRWLSWNGAGR
jgi:hypothetical protein